MKKLKHEAERVKAAPQARMKYVGKINLSHPRFSGHVVKQHPEVLLIFWTPTQPAA